MSSPAPPPKGGGRSKLFGRPDALLVDSDGPRISMPPPPPTRAEVVAPIAVVPPPEEATGPGPARVFIGLPGKAPQPRIATPTWDEENTDERSRDEMEEPASFGVAAYAASGPAVLPKGEVASLTLGLDRSAATPRSVAPPPPVEADPSFRRPGSPVLRLAASLDADEDDEPRPVAVAAAPPKPAPPAPRAAQPTEPRALWEGLPESEPAPRPVVPVRRPVRTSPELTPPPTPAPPVFTPPGRTPHTISPTGMSGEPARPTPVRPSLGRAGGPATPTSWTGAAASSTPRPVSQTRPAPVGPPPREPMPLRPPAPGSVFPPPGGRRELPKTDPRELPANVDPAGGVLPWALLGLGLVIAAGGVWYFGFGPGRGEAPLRPAPVSEVNVPVPPPAPPPSPDEPLIPIPATPPTEPIAIETPVDPASILGTGMLSIEADRKAVIYVDGVKRGTIPELAPFEITAGEHTVRAVAGRVTRTVTVRVDEGAARKVLIDFKK